MKHRSQKEYEAEIDKIKSNGKTPDEFKDEMEKTLFKLGFHKEFIKGYLQGWGDGFYFMLNADK